MDSISCLAVSEVIILGPGADLRTYRNGVFNRRQIRRLSGAKTKTGKTVLHAAAKQTKPQ